MGYTTNLNWFAGFQPSTGVKLHTPKNNFINSNFQGKLFSWWPTNLGTFFWSKRRLHQGNQNFEVTLGIDFFWWQNIGETK